MHALKPLFKIFKMGEEHLFCLFNSIQFNSTLFILQLSQSGAFAGRKHGKQKQLNDKCVPLTHTSRCYTLNTYVGSCQHQYSLILSSCWTEKQPSANTSINEHLDSRVRNCADNLEYQCEK